jgi:hypothetical protein
LVDEIFFATLPQFISGKDKVRFKLKNCLVDSISFVEGDQNTHVFFYFNPPVDVNFDVSIESKGGNIVAESGGKWGDIKELIDVDEELKKWISELYESGIIRTSKKINVVPRDSGSRVEISVKKLEKDWRDALAKMNASPKAVVEKMFNIANRIISGISNWQGKQVEPWNPVEITKGRAAPVTPKPAEPATAPTLRPAPTPTPSPAVATSSAGSSGFKLPVIPSEEEETAPATAAAPTPAQPAAQPIICPMCGVENKPGSLVCFRCQNPLT